MIFYASADVPGSEELWAEHGLTGLVLFALFVLIFIFLRTNARKDANHQNFLERLLAAERKERSEARSESKATTDRLSQAIDHLTESLRQNDPRPPSNPPPDA